ncbi:Beta-TrCP [Arthrobotrys entomopaga]|nr:Beta-TrCP [Arthrobotrys entomopaga]
MNISPFLLQRSLGLDVPPTKLPTDDISHIFTSRLYNDLDYDVGTHFTATRRGIGGHAKGVNCIGADETEGRWMVSGGADGSLLVWDLEQEYQRHKIRASTMVTKKDRATHGVSSIKFNPHNSSLFSTTSYSATLSLYTLTPTNPTLLQTYSLDSHLYTHSNSPASISTAIIAVAGSSPHIRLIDPRTTSASQTLFGHISAVLSVAWSPLYASILASGGADGSVRLWDIRFGATCLGTLDVNRAPQPANRAAGSAHVGGVNGLLWTNDGRRVVSAGMDGRIRVWGMEDGRHAGVVFPPVVRNKYQAAFPMVLAGDGGADEEMLWIGSEEQLIAFDLEDGRMLKRIAVPKVEVKDGIGRITGLVERKGHSELYTCHAWKSNRGIEDGREGLAKWKSKWLCKDEKVAAEKTEGQKMLQDIFERATKKQVRFT